MASMYRLDDLRSLQTKVQEKAHDLFKAKAGISPLQVTRIFRNSRANELAEKDNIPHFFKDQDVWNSAQVKALRNDSDDATQIFTIRQDRSWTTLNISLDVFEGFMRTFEITPNFWRCMFAFGRKSEENEFEFPGFNRRKTHAGNSSVAVKYEFSYMLRRVELNGRNGADGECPWSIRQTAVYHQLTCEKQCLNLGQVVNVNEMYDSRSTFLLVAPFESAKAQFTDGLEQKLSGETAGFSCWNTHRILVADSLRGWSDYMAFLQKKLKDQSNEIVLATVGNNKANLSPLTDFNINFAHRQELKIVEDQVLDLQVILPSMIDSIRGVREACVRFQAEYPMEDGKKLELEAIIEEFEDYEKQAAMLSDRAKVLKANAESTAQLEKSTKDAAAVKILTVITLVYLPTTIVANFFSTEFVKMSETNNMQVSRDVWLLAAISIPLTMLTVVLWWAWVHFTKVEPAVSPEHPGFVTLQRKHSIRSVVSSKKRQPTLDLESGLGSPRSPATLFSPSPASTWDSTRTATTVKFG
ncbi:hypothetical protein DL95DRAFT_369317 [Leptodontidium sp. 2 PMI_412]|nr:hypothetical protein DL95DRAFT_369317 [Leptodontidium sp. 2 PMI_412]